MRWTDDDFTPKSKISAHNKQSLIYVPGYKKDSPRRNEQELLLSRMDYHHLSECKGSVFVIKCNTFFEKSHIRADVEDR